MSTIINAARLLLARCPLFLLGMAYAARTDHRGRAGAAARLEARINTATVRTGSGMTALIRIAFCRQVARNWDPGAESSCARTVVFSSGRWVPPG